MLWRMVALRAGPGLRRRQRTGPTWDPRSARTRASSPVCTGRLRRHLRLFGRLADVREDLGVQLLETVLREMAFLHEVVARRLGQSASRFLRTQFGRLMLLSSSDIECEYGRVTFARTSARPLRARQYATAFVSTSYDATGSLLSTSPTGTGSGSCARGRRRCAAGRLHVHGHRDRVAVVLDEEQHGQL